MAKRRRNEETLDLEGGMEQLFREPLSDFISSRNALARRLQTEGRTDEAAYVKTLGRPSAAAWALNQLYWNERALFDRLLTAGDRLRTAQQAAVRSRSGAADLRQTVEDRQEAVNQATDRAAALLRQSGNPVTATTQQRIAATAEALASYGREQAVAHAGRLVKDLQPPGFEALASLTFPDDAAAAAVPKPRGRVIRMPAPDRPATPSQERTRKTSGEAERRRERQREADRRRALARARSDLVKLEKELDARRAALERATIAEQSAEETLNRLQASAEDAARRLQEAQERATKAARALADAQASRADAESAVSQADRIVREAREALREFEE